MGKIISFIQTWWNISDRLTKTKTSPKFCKHITAMNEDYLLIENLWMQDSTLSSSTEEIDFF